MGWESREEPWAVDVVRGVVGRAVCVSVVKTVLVDGCGWECVFAQHSRYDFRIMMGSTQSTWANDLQLAQIIDRCCLVTASPHAGHCAERLFIRSRLQSAVFLFRV